MSNDGQRIKLLELRSTYKWGGGPDKTILLSAERHDPARFEVILCYLKGADDHEFDIGDRARAKGLEIVELAESSKIDFPALKRIAKICDERQIDIIHAHDYKTNLYAWLISKIRRGVKIMTTTHGWIGDTQALRLYNWIDLKVLKRYRNIVAVSGATRSVLTGAGISPERITMIHNGIDEQAWNPSAGEPAFRREFGIPENAPLIGAIGRLGEEKDLVTWLDAAKRVRDVHPDAWFALIGDGSERENLKRYAAEIGMQDRVLFTGYRKDLPNIYRSLDLHLMTSVTEGLPNSLLEAMAMGVPTVSTSVGGITEIVKDGENGYLYRPKELRGISQRLLDLLADPKDAARIADNARKTIEEEFSFAARMRKIESYYEALVQGRLAS